MAKYTITYKCGHDTVVQIYGKATDRDNKVTRMSKEYCPKCTEQEYIRINDLAEYDILYRDYKEIYNHYQKVIDSYDAAAKTIKVIGPKSGLATIDEIAQMLQAVGVPYENASQWILKGANKIKQTLDRFPDAQNEEEEKIQKAYLAAYEILTQHNLIYGRIM
mgnify:CR=1 FL=1